MKRILKFLFFALLLVFVNSCEDTELAKKDDYSTQLSEIANAVILPTYKNLYNDALVLNKEAINFSTNPSETTLKDLRKAWIVARSPWEQSEAFLFGPVEQEGLDPALDSWPVNVTDLNNVLNSNYNITPSFLAQQEGNLKGFHTIEFLLWGEKGVKTNTEFTARELEYLIACTKTLADDAQKLYDAWRPEKGNYIRNIVEAGKSTSIYISQKSAIEEITSALIIIADEVANGKINDPFASQDVSLEESRFSSNSKIDFADNMRSIQNIYNGKFESNTTSDALFAIVKSKNSNLATKINDEIGNAIKAIEDIDGSFTNAIFNAKADVEQAQKAVRKLQFTLESELLPLISNL